MQPTLLLCAFSLLFTFGLVEARHERHQKHQKQEKQEKIHRLRPVHRRARHQSKSLSPSSAVPQPAALTELEFFEGERLLAAATRQIGEVANQLRTGHQVIHSSSQLILLQLLPTNQRDTPELLALLGDLWDSLHRLQPQKGMNFLKRYERETGRGAGDYQSISQVFASILWQILPLAPANRLTRAKFIYSLLSRAGDDSPSDGISAALLKGTSAMRIDYSAVDMPNSFIDEEEGDEAEADDEAEAEGDNDELPESVDQVQDNQSPSVMNRIFRKAGHGAAFLPLLGLLSTGVPQMQFLLSNICWANGVSTDNCSPAIASIAHFTSQPLPSDDQLRELEALLDEYAKALEAIEACAEVPVFSALLKRFFVVERGESDSALELFSVSPQQRLGNPQCPAAVVEVRQFGPYRPALGRSYLYRK